MVFIGIPDTLQCSSRQSKRVSFFFFTGYQDHTLITSSMSREQWWASTHYCLSPNCIIYLVRRVQFLSECFRDVWNCKAVRAKHLGTSQKQFIGIPCLLPDMGDPMLFVLFENDWVWFDIQPAIIYQARSQNCEKRLVCLSLRTEQHGSHWTDFHEIWYLSIFRKPFEQIQVSLKSE